MEEVRQILTVSAHRHNDYFNSYRHRISRILNGVFRNRVGSRHYFLRTCFLYLNGLVLQNTVPNPFL